MSTQKDLFEQWLLELNHQWGVDCLKLSSTMRCHLTVGRSKVSFALSPDEREILLWSAVTSADRFLKDRELLTNLLILNCSEVSLGGTTFSIDQDRRYILLNYRAPIKILDAQELGNLLWNFAEAASNAERVLVDAPLQSDSSDHASPLANNHLHIMRP